MKVRRERQADGVHAAARLAATTNDLEPDVNEGNLNGLLSSRSATCGLALDVALGQPGHLVAIRGNAWGHQRWAARSTARRNLASQQVSGLTRAAVLFRRPSRSRPSAGWPIRWAVTTVAAIRVSRRRLNRARPVLWWMCAGCGGSQSPLRPGRSISPAPSCRSRRRRPGRHGRCRLPALTPLRVVLDGSGGAKARAGSGGRG